jgi:VanZ family protein
MGEKRIRFIKYQLPLLLWLTAQLIGTSIPRLHGVAPMLPHFDKLLHFAAYFGLAFLLARFIASKKEYGEKELQTMLWRVIVVCLSIAVFDELHQIPIPGREFSFFDLLADTLGIVAGSYSFRYLRNRWRIFA